MEIEFHKNGKLKSIHISTRIVLAVVGSACGIKIITTFM